MNKSIVVILTFLTIFPVFSQDAFEQFISSVKANNKSLAVARDYSEYLKTSANTGLNPSDPELSFKYLFDHSEGAGKMFEMEVVQSFEFPTVYFDRNTRRDHAVEMAEINYRHFERHILIEAKILFSELVYLNKLIRMYSTKSDFARKSFGHFKRKFDIGEVSIFALNKSKLLLRNTLNELTLAEIERENILADMALMSGNYSFDKSVIVFDTKPFGDYEKSKMEYLSKHPELNMASTNIKLKESEKSIANALSLPNFHIGFGREQEADMYMQGIQFGLSIPLYEHSNKSQEAENALNLSISENAELVNAVSSEFDKLYNSYSKLKTIIEETRDVLSTINNIEFLQKAVDLGEITTTDFFYEIQQFYDTQKSLYELEKELNSIQANMIID